MEFPNGQMLLIFDVCPNPQQVSILGKDKLSDGILDFLNHELNSPSATIFIHKLDRLHKLAHLEGQGEQ